MKARLILITLAKEDFKYSAKDIRFTTKGATLYAIALGWPEEGKLVIRSLAATDEPAQNKIEKVELLGRVGVLSFSQTTNGLTVELPAEKLSDLANSLRIAGSNFKPAPIAETGSDPGKTPPVITPDKYGRLIFGAADVTLHGEFLKLEEQAGKPNIGYWDHHQEWVSWKGHVEKPGVYLVSATVASPNGEAVFVLDAAGKNISAKVSQTAGWDKYATTDIGTVEVKSAGDFTVAVRAKDAESWQAINLASLRFVPGSQ